MDFQTVHYQWPFNLFELCGIMDIWPTGKSAEKFSFVPCSEILYNALASKYRTHLIYSLLLSMAIQKLLDSEVWIKKFYALASTLYVRIAIEPGCLETLDSEAYELS